VWTILEHKRCTKEVADAPLQVREKYEFWKNVVRHGGPEGLRQLKGFHDEALAGKLRGFRSSRLNQAWRVMYRIDRERVTVSVERVSNHDYSA
jgi:mRNA-degrading endonuclease YafQ of YafQ-DinJ toxin-antitoxin module